MENEPIGRVLTEVTIESVEDLWAEKRGLCAHEQVRKITVPDALSPGAPRLCRRPAIQIAGRQSRTGWRTRL